VCYSRRPRHHPAQGYPTGSANPRRAELLVIALLFFTLQFFEMHTILISLYLEVAILPMIATRSLKVELSFIYRMFD
jgi:hypothetical protein